MHDVQLEVEFFEVARDDVFIQLEILIFLLLWKNWRQLLICLLSQQISKAPVKQLLGHSPRLRLIIQLQHEPTNLRNLHRRLLLPTFVLLVQLQQYTPGRYHFLAFSQQPALQSHDVFNLIQDSEVHVFVICAVIAVLCIPPD